MGAATTMTHATRTWPTQVRLPGQAAVHDGPIDLLNMYLMHHGFRRDLGRFARAVPRTPVDARATWAGLARRWEVFAEALHLHHTSEDAGLWPWLRERATPAEQETLRAMEREHGGIDALLRAGRDGLRSLSAGADEATRGALAERMSAARDEITQHLDHEERDTFAILQRLMSPDAWRQFERQHIQKKLSLGYVLRVTPWALDEVSDAVLGQTFAAPGGGAYKLLWRLLRGRYAKLDRAAFSYL